MIYGQGFFPFSQPVEVSEGDRIELRLAADLCKTIMFGVGTRFHRSKKASFKQSTFYGVPLSTAQLR
jgi:hypothetical protein